MMIIIMMNMFYDYVKSYNGFIMCLFELVLAHSYKDVDDYIMMII